MHATATAPTPPRSGRPCRSACTRPASARASTSTGRSATRRSVPATSPPSSRASTRSSRAPCTRRGSCATTRCTSGSIPRTSSASGSASGATRRIPAEPVLAVPRPLEAPRQGLTFSPAVVVAALLTVFIAVFAVFIGIQLVRFAKPPTIAVTDPAQAVIDVAEDATSYTLPRHVDPEGHREHHGAGPERAVPDHRRCRRALEPGRRAPPRAATSSTSTRSTPTPARRRSRPSGC